MLRKQGYTWAHLAEVCGVHVGTVPKRARRATAGGLYGAIKALWNRRAVMLAVKQLLAIDTPIRASGEYPRRWGFTPQRPDWFSGETGCTHVN